MRGEPYTHAIHAQRTREAAKSLQVVSGAHVQCLVGGVLCCARIMSAWKSRDGHEMWQLSLEGPLYAKASSPAKNVRQCSGIDANCTCERYDQARSAGEAAQELATGREAGAEGVTC